MRGPSKYNVHPCSPVKGSARLRRSSHNPRSVNCASARDPVRNPGYFRGKTWARPVQTPLPMKLSLLSSSVLVAALATLSACSGGDASTDATGTDEAAATRDTVRTLYTISYAPNSYVIGNAYAGWTDAIQGEPQFSKGPGNP